MAIPTEKASFSFYVLTLSQIFLSTRGCLLRCSNDFSFPVDLGALKVESTIPANVITDRQFCGIALVVFALTLRTADRIKRYAVDRWLVFSDALSSRLYVSA